MYLTLALGGVAFLASLVLTPAVRDSFHRLGILDEPDSTRKFHSKAVPRVGGVAIVLAYVAAFLAVFFGPVSFPQGSVLQEAMPQVWALLPAIAVIFATGLLDDIIGLNAWQKLLGQLCAACLAVSSGVVIPAVANHPLSSLISIPLSILWLLLCTNAFNLIDGLDGLAAGLGLFATVTMVIAGLTFGDISLAIVTAPLVGALLGFLRYNFSPASVFLGDCGSLLIGFVLGCCGVLWSQKATTLLAMTAPVMAVSIPLFDVALSIARRYLRKQPIFTGDRGHIHHRLLDRGITPRGVALLMYGCAACAATLSLIEALAFHRAGGIVVVLFCVGVWVGIQQLGYVEFDMARKLIFQGQFRSIIDGQTRLLTFERSLAKAQSVEDCWKVVSDFSEQFGFVSASLHIDNTIYTNLNNHRRDGSSWSIFVPLTDTHHIELRRSFTEAVDPTFVPAFISIATNGIKTKLMPDMQGVGAMTTRKALASISGSSMRSEVV